LLRLGRNDEAIDWVRAAKEQSSGASTFLSLWLTAAFAHAGKGEEARRELREFISQRPASTVRGMRHDWPPVSGPAEERQHEIDGLEIAGLRDHVDEDADPGLPITAGPRSANLTAPTPIGAPGVTTIRTSELSALVGNRHSSASNAAPPLVLSTICAGCKDIDFPGAVPVPAAHHRAPLDDKARQDLKAWLDRLSGGDQTRHLITMSWNAEQWQSRNLAMELVAVGYANVTWYRGGLEAWDAAGLPVVKRQ
jgi:adenylate cyclase